MVDMAWCVLTTGGAGAGFLLLVPPVCSLGLLGVVAGLEIKLDNRSKLGSLDLDDDKL